MATKTIKILRKNQTEKFKYGLLNMENKELASRKLLERKIKREITA